MRFFIPIFYLMPHSRLFIILSWTGLCLLSLYWLVFPSNADTPHPTPMPEVSIFNEGTLPNTGPLSGDGPWIFRAYYTDPKQLQNLAQWTEPWEVNHVEGYVVVEVHHLIDYERLRLFGFILILDPVLTAQLQTPRQRLPSQRTGIPGYPCYRTVEETYTAAQTMTTSYPHLAMWLDIGDSWEKTQDAKQGYDLMVLKLTNTQIAGPKPKLFIMTALHAREYATAELNTRFGEYLVTHYDQDPDVTWLLDYHEIHLLLQANPDGRKKAETGLLWRKNTNNNHCPNTDYRGVDLNRNFRFQWGCCNGSDSDSCSNIYRGSSSASEPETTAVQDYLYAIFPDQRADVITAPVPITATGLFLDIHSYGELVLWPWGFTNQPSPNQAALQTLGHKFAFFNHYKPYQAFNLYPTDGTTDDFAYGELGLAAYTFELGTNFFQNCADFENTILPDNLPALLYAAKVARAPYLLSGGPDVVDLVVSSPQIEAGQTLILTATLDATRYHQSNDLEIHAISTAMVTLDSPP